MANDSWKSPKGKLLTKSDSISIPISRADLPALHAAIDKALSCVGEFDGSVRFKLAEQLIQIRKTVLDATWDHDDVPLKERSYE